MQIDVLQLDVLHTVVDMEQLAGEWNDLLAYSASHVPFLRNEYLSAWWQTLGGGEWPAGDLYLVTGRHADGALAGIAPLFFTNNREDAEALMLLGSVEISDYLDIIARPEHVLAFTGELLRHLAGPQAPPWSVLDWYNLLEDSPTLPALEFAARQMGWEYTQEPLQPAPFVPLPGDWEIYLAGIDKKQRHEVRRKLRRAENNPAPVRWYIVEEAAGLEAEIDAFLLLMAEDEAKRDFLTVRMQSQMRATAHAAFRANWLQLSFLEVGGEKAAGYLNFDFGNHIWVYNSGINPRFRDLSPGWVLLGYLLQWANEHGRAAFDFMRGGEDYKYRFGGVNRSVVRARVRR
jgi:CelD/BcsL family acetyltransferase involved in cellulose biosynthesis